MQNKGHFAIQGHIQGHRFWYQSKAPTTSFLSVININLPAILHWLRDIAFEMSKIALVWLPVLRLNPPTDGFPYDDECQRMSKVAYQTA